MALITCPECKKEISDACAACPGCGYPILKRKRQEKLTGTAHDIKMRARTTIIFLQTQLPIIISFVLFCVATICVFLAPLPSINSYDSESIYNLPPPHDCNDNFTLKKHYERTDGYNPLDDDFFNSPYYSHGEAVVFSGSAEETNAIRCVIWKEYQGIKTLSSNSMAGKLGLLSGVLLDPVLIFPLLFLMYLLAFIISQQRKFSIIYFIVIGCFIGFITNQMLSDEQIFRPTELVVIHFLSTISASLFYLFIFNVIYSLRMSSTINRDTDNY